MAAGTKSVSKISSPFNPLTKRKAWTALKAHSRNYPGRAFEEIVRRRS